MDIVLAPDSSFINIEHEYGINLNYDGTMRNVTYQDNGQFHDYLRKIIMIQHGNNSGLN